MPNLPAGKSYNIPIELYSLDNNGKLIEAILFEDIITPLVKAMTGSTYLVSSTSNVCG